jgi:tetratricopeptide (TPR) repeat protein
MTASVHDKAEDSNFVVAAFVERDRKLRLVVMTAGAVAVAFVIALTVASVQAGLAASRERAMAEQTAARLDSMTGVFTQVEWSYQRALAADEKTLGPNHPDVARDLNSLAALYAAAGRYLEAEPLMRRALAIDGQHFSQSSMKVASDLFGLAEVYTKLGRSADAEPLYKRAKEIYANLGSKYPGD